MTTGVMIENDNGNQRFIGRNTRMPTVDGESLWHESLEGDNKKLVVESVAAIDAIIDEVAGTTPAIPTTMAEVLDEIYFFFWRGLRFTGC